MAVTTDDDRQGDEELYKHNHHTEDIATRLTGPAVIDETGAIGDVGGRDHVAGIKADAKQPDEQHGDSGFGVCKGHVVPDGLD